MSFWQNKKVLVTGAGGFIGSHLVEELVMCDANVLAFIKYNSRNDWGNLELLDKSIRENIEIFTADIQDGYAVKKAMKKRDIVFHLAALIGIPYSYVAPLHYINTNINGTLNILEACLTENVSRVIHTSTSEVYGTAIYTPIDENHPQRGQSPYAASKIGSDKLAESYYLSYDSPISIIRPFNTFGPRQSGRAIIPTIITQALSGTGKIKLGRVDPIRDFLYVRDTVKGFLAIAESKKSIGQIINIGSGEGISIGELANTIVKMIGNQTQIEMDEERIRPQKSEVFELVCDYRKAKEMLNWGPKVNLKEGLEKTIQYIKINLSKYKADIYNV